MTVDLNKLKLFLSAVPPLRRVGGSLVSVSNPAEAWMHDNGPGSKMSLVRGKELHLISFSGLGGISLSKRGGSQVVRTFHPLHDKLMGFLQSQDLTDDARTRVLEYHERQEKFLDKNGNLKLAALLTDAMRDSRQKGKNYLALSAPFESMSWRIKDDGGEYEQLVITLRGQFIKVAMKFPTGNYLPMDCEEDDWFGEYSNLRMRSSHLVKFTSEMRDELRECFLENLPAGAKTGLADWDEAAERLNRTTKEELCLPEPFSCMPLVTARRR